MNTTAKSAKTEKSKASAPKVGEEEKPYAVLTMKFFRRKGLQVEGEHIELLAPGHVHKVIPRVYAEMRRIRAKHNFDSDRLRREAMDKTLKKNEAEDIPVKRVREIV